MGFNAFPSFRKKEPRVEVSKDTYPDTAPLRDNADALAENSRKSIEYFDKNTRKQFQRMFDLDRRGKAANRNIEWENITPEEMQDVKNFVSFASKRLAAGAATSDAFHKEVEKGKVGKAFHELAPVNNVGHDSMHSMMAYASTGGGSLVPAYMKLDNRTRDTYTDPHANLEEAYVVAFSDLNLFANKIKSIKERSALKGEELVNVVMTEWEEDGLYGFQYKDPDFPRNNRMPEFVTTIRNLVSNIEEGKEDPNFPIHEFQRILSPLLERLRMETPATKTQDINAS